MLISVRQLERFWAVAPAGVLHVGAHEAEELTDYQAAGWSPVVWVEGLPDKAAQLQDRLRGTADQSVISALVWDADGESLTMWRTNNGQSSSALPFGTHRIEHPEVRVVEELSVQSARLDTLLQGTAHRFDFINLDIQGAELRALRGLGDRIRDVRWIYCEVNKKPLYVGAHLVSEIDEYLAPLGFRRVDTDMTPHGWGDALYVRADAVPALPRLRRAMRWFITWVMRSRVVPAAVEDHPLMWLAHWGAVTVVSAMEDYEFRALKVQSMGETVERAGMDWHRLPIPDGGVPDERFEDLWIYSGHRLRQELLGGRTILVHCKGGWTRWSALLV